MPYSSPLGKTSFQLEQELLVVYEKYPEYKDEMSFADMVKEFAEDDFFNLHLVAKEYLKCPYFNVMHGEQSCN